jgi:uncharacterized membrane-anchored protein
VAIDSVLHIIVGGLITVILFSNKVKGIVVLFVLVSLALGKELYDHFFVLGHCYPACMDEHISDFLFSLLFFFLYLPILSFTQKASPRLTYNHYVAIWALVASTHFAFRYYIDQQNNITLLASNEACKRV